MDFEMKTKFMTVLLKTTQGSNPLQDALQDLSDDCSGITTNANHIHSMEIKSYGNRNPINCNCCANHIIPIEIEIQSIVTTVQTI